MKLKQIIIGLLVMILSALGGGYTATNLGSIQDGQAYNATTTYKFNGAPTLANPVVLKSNMAGTLGSVVITGAVAGPMKFYDATSTTDVSSTTLTILPASLAAGTYTFDVAFSRGLILGTTANLVPTSTITWR